MQLDQPVLEKSQHNPGKGKIKKFNRFQANFCLNAGDAKLFLVKHDQTEKDEADDGSKVYPVEQPGRQPKE